MLFRVLGPTALGLIVCAAPGFADPSQVIAGRCHMDVCSWFRILETNTIKSTDRGTLIRAKEVSGESPMTPDGHHGQKTTIKWGKPTTQYVFCSEVRPATIFEFEGHWMAHLISPGYSAGVFGYNTDDYAKYFRICHGLAKVDPNDVSLAKRFGYPESLVDQVNQIDLNSPEDILSK